MGNHPNRGRKAPGANPMPEEIRAAREAAGLTQTAAAKIIYATLRAWQDWESGARRMHPAMWEYWKLLTSFPAVREARAEQYADEPEQAPSDPMA